MALSSLWSWATAQAPAVAADNDKRFSIPNLESAVSYEGRLDVSRQGFSNCTVYIGLELDATR